MVYFSVVHLLAKCSEKTVAITNNDNLVAGQLVNELERSLYFFISDSKKVMKFYSWIQLAIVYLHINFQSQKILTNFVI